MMGLRFALMTALAPLLGLWVSSVSPVARLPRPARLAVYAASGLVTLAVEMLLFSVIGLRWSIPLLSIAPVLLYIALRLRRRSAMDANAPGKFELSAASGLIGVGLLALTLASAAATSFDYLLFWGLKGQAFGMARTIDVGFLRNPDHADMHPDYPPLLPFYYAWTMLGAEGFDWWGGIHSAAILLLLSALAMDGFARAAGTGGAGAMAGLFGSMFAFLLIQNSAGGGAEPMLLFFETVALAALVCRRNERPEFAVVISLALTGSVLTKVEGLVFAAIVVLLVAASAGIRTAAAVAVAPTAAIGIWWLYCNAHHLLDQYTLHASRLTAQSMESVLAQLVRQASFGIAYAPWIVLLLVIACGRFTRALPFLASAAVYLPFLLVVYGGGNASAMTIEWAATRVLLAPLLLVFFGAVAALTPVPDRGER